MASRVFRFHCLTAIAVAGLAFLLAPAPAASADGHGYRAPRMHTPMPRWHRHAPRIRTVYRSRFAPVRYVERVRPRTTWHSEPVAPLVIAAPAYSGCGGCAPAPVVQPVVEYVHYIQPIVRYARTAPYYDYAPAYNGCGSCESYVVQQWAGYGSGCGGCGATVAAPYYGSMYRNYGYGNGYGYGYRYGYGYGYGVR